MTTTKITGLTSMNHDALRQAVEKWALDDPRVVITKITATFPWDAEDTRRNLQAAKDRLISLGYGSRSHPVASLNAVIRKAAKAAQTEV